MPKEFYTERDIEDLFKRGVTTLETNDDVVLTQLAYEKANRLGMKLLRDRPDHPPDAPVRPYISQKQPQKQARPAFAAGGSGTAPSCAASESASLEKRLREAVLARMGSQVDAKLLDVIIRRVLGSAGVK